jgi:hypothetical protein
MVFLLDLVQFSSPIDIRHFDFFCPFTSHLPKVRFGVDDRIYTLRSDWVELFGDRNHRHLADGSRSANHRPWLIEYGNKFLIRGNLELNTGFHINGGRCYRGFDDLPLTRSRHCWPSLCVCGRQSSL